MSTNELVTSFRHDSTQFERELLALFDELEQLRIHLQGKANELAMENRLLLEQKQQLEQVRDQLTDELGELRRLVQKQAHAVAELPE